MTIAERLAGFGAGLRFEALPGWVRIVTRAARALPAARVAAAERAALALDALAEAGILLRLCRP